MTTTTIILILLAAWSLLGPCALFVYAKFEEAFTGRLDKRVVLILAGPLAWAVALYCAWFLKRK